MIDISNVKKNLGATAVEIEKVECQMNAVFPEIHKEILRWSNGFLINNRITSCAS